MTKAYSLKNLNVCFLEKISQFTLMDKNIKSAGIAPYYKINFLVSFETYNIAKFST